MIRWRDLGGNFTTAKSPKPHLCEVNNPPKLAIKPAFISTRVGRSGKTHTSNVLHLKGNVCTSVAQFYHQLKIYTLDFVQIRSRYVSNKLQMTKLWGWIRGSNCIKTRKNWENFIWDLVSEPVLLDVLQMLWPLLLSLIKNSNTYPIGSTTALGLWVEIMIYFVQPYTSVYIFPDSYIMLISAQTWSNLMLVNQKVWRMQTLDINCNSKAAISLILTMTLTLYWWMYVHAY